MSRAEQSNPETDLKTIESGVQSSLQLEHEPGFFKTRALLLAVLAFSVFAGTALFKLNQARVQAWAVADLESKGGVVTYAPRVMWEWARPFLWKHLTDQAVTVEFVDQQVTYIDSIQYLPNVTKVRLESTNVYDISPLRDLFYLEQLLIDNSPVRDMSPVEYSIDLKVVHLNRTRVRDLTPLAALQLEELRFVSTPIRTLVPLSQMGSLKRLAMSDTHVDDLNPISELTELTHVNMDNCNVTDLRPLENIKSLEDVSLRGLPVRISAIARLDLALPNWDFEMFTSGALIK